MDPTGGAEGVFPSEAPIHLGNAVRADPVDSALGDRMFRVSGSFFCFHINVLRKGRELLVGFLLFVEGFLEQFCEVIAT